MFLLILLTSCTEHNSLFLFGTNISDCSKPVLREVPRGLIWFIIYELFEMDNPIFEPICESDIVENVVMSVDDLFPYHEDNNKTLQKDVDFLNISYFKVDFERILLILKHPANLYFAGSFYVECLSGTVDVHGFTLRPEYEPCLVVSGFGHSAMCFSSKADQPTGVNLDELEVELSKRKILKLFKEQLSQMSSASCVLILSKVHDLPIRDVFKLSKFQCFEIPRNNSFSYFDKLEEWLGCLFDFSSGSHIPQKMKYDQSLRKLADGCLSWEGIILYFTLIMLVLSCS